MLGTSASEVLQQSNYCTELELWLGSRRRGFANWRTCSVTFFEGGQGNFLALADVRLYSPRLGAATYRGAGDKSLARPGRKEATAIGDIDFHVSYL